MNTTHNLVIVAAPYHDAVRNMIDIARDEIERTLATQLLDVREVPGSFEIPLEVARVCDNTNVAGVVTLGAIEKGETGHGEAIAGAVFHELVRLSVHMRKPIGLGTIGPRATLDQIQQRAQSVAQEAVRAVARGV